MPESLHRSMRERGVLDWFSQAIGVKSANIGEKGFDDRFAVRSAPGGFAANVFSSTSRRHKIVQLPHIRRMRVKDKKAAAPLLKAQQALFAEGAVVLSFGLFRAVG